MARLKLSDGNGIALPAENRRTSQRVTRTSSRQVKEDNGKGSKRTSEGKGTTHVWTPGISFIRSILTTRSRDSIRLISQTKQITIKLFQLQATPTHFP